MKHTFTLKNGTDIEIEIDEIMYIATARTLAGETIGTVEFGCIEVPNGYYLKITNAFLDKSGRKFLRQGIGTECITLMSEATGLPICAVASDGHRRDDGSHLTGDAPAFVSSLLKRKIITEC